jgi:uncharacterized linocin/CFP29 family protein
MQEIQRIGTDEQLLTTEQYQLILNEIVTAARKPLVGRLVMPLQDHPWEISEVKYYKQTDMNKAAIGMAMVQGNADVVGLTPKTKSVPVIWKDFLIYARDLAASARTGVPLDTGFATDAGRRVSELEEEMVWNGKEGFEGFLNLTGRDTLASAGAWSTAGNAYTDARKAIGQLGANGFGGPYTMVVTPTQLADLQILFSSTGIPQLTQIKSLCNVVVSYFFAASTSAIMCAPDKSSFELRYSPLYTHNALTKEGDYFFRVYEAVMPFFKAGRELSVVEVTGVTV